MGVEVIILIGNWGLITPFRRIYYPTASQGHLPNPMLGLWYDLYRTNRPPSRNKAQRTPRLCQATRYKLVYRITLHGYRAHLQLAGHPYPWICQLPKGTRSDRSPTFGRTQRESIYAIRSMVTRREPNSSERWGIFLLSSFFRQMCGLFNLSLKQPRKVCRPLWNMKTFSSVVSTLRR